MSSNLCWVCDQPLNASVDHHIRGETHPIHTACVVVFRETLEECPICNIPEEQLQFHGKIDKPVNAQPRDIDWNDPVNVEKRIRVVAKEIQGATGLMQAIAGFRNATRIQERLKAVKEKIQSSNPLVEEDIKFLEAGLAELSKSEEDLSKIRENYQAQMIALEVMHELNLLDPLQMDRLIADCNKTIKICTNSLKAIEGFETLYRPVGRFDAALQSLAEVKGKMKPELQKEVDQEVEFIQMKLGFMLKLKKIYQEMKEKEENHLQFLMQTKRSPADSECVVMLNRETDKGTLYTQKILIC